MGETTFFDPHPFFAKGHPRSLSEAQTITGNVDEP